MDEASLMNLLTTAPPMAAFAGYLVYQNKMDFKDDANLIRSSLAVKIEGINKQIDEMEKKFDRLLMIVDKIQEKLTELRIKDIARGGE